MLRLWRLCGWLERLRSRAGEVTQYIAGTAGRLYEWLSLRGWRERVLEVWGHLCELPVVFLSWCALEEALCLELGSTVCRDR
jgi:hypothetical protein